MPFADELTDWLRLEQTAGVGPDTGRKLLAAFGLPGNIFSASLSALQAVVPDRVARALAGPMPLPTQDLIDRVRLWLAIDGNHVLTLGDASYPRALLDIPDPPLLLYVKGRLDLLSAPTIAVVGSRNATTQGIANADSFSEILAQSGCTISSGMALGIDTAAHHGSLRGGRLSTNHAATIAVIGTGIDIVYPARNRALAHQIAEQGCIVSEYPLGMPAIAANFPRRNRIISGLARGVLVIEAAAQSGSLITARMAAEQGRDVFAIPGSIHAPLSKGCHQLIKQGAKLVESAQDILDELHYHDAARTPSRAARRAPMADEPNDCLLAAIGFDPIHIDMIACRSNLDLPAITAQLLPLELDGKIEMLPGGLYRRLG